MFGMKRAIFSNEAGQGSSPIAHCAARTREPVREGLVAGLEPFIDTLVVCTFTALIILATGIWNRPPDARFDSMPTVTRTPSGWQFANTVAPPDLPWRSDERVILMLTADKNQAHTSSYHRIEGTVTGSEGKYVVNWDLFQGEHKPEIAYHGFYKSYVGATLTAKAFDSVHPGLGKWLITIAVWLFALSTIITWAYYGEQGVSYLFGAKGTLPFHLVYCLLIVIATLGHIQTDADLDNLTGIGLGVLVWGNIPITLLFGHQAMRAYRDYVARLKSGNMGKGNGTVSQAGRTVQS